MFNQKSCVIDCTARNLSEGGARLHVASVVGVPRAVRAADRWHRPAGRNDVANRTRNRRSVSVGLSGRRFIDFPDWAGGYVAALRAARACKVIRVDRFVGAVPDAEFLGRAGGLEAFGVLDGLGGEELVLATGLYSPSMYPVPHHGPARRGAFFLCAGVRANSASEDSRRNSPSSLALVRQPRNSGRQQALLTHRREENCPWFSKAGDHLNRNDGNCR